MKRNISGVLAVFLMLGLFLPVSASAAPKIGFQKKFSNQTIKAAKKYGDGLKTNACLNKAAKTAAKKYAKSRKFNSADRRVVVRAAQKCGTVEVGVQASRQKKASRVIAKTSKANKKRLKNATHTLLGARSFKRGKKRYTVMIVAAPKPSKNASFASSVHSSLKGLSTPTAKTNSCLLRTANAAAKEFATSNKRTKKQATSWRLRAAEDCDLEQVVLFDSNHSSVKKVVAQVQAVAADQLSDPKFTRLAVRSWTKGKAKYTTVMFAAPKVLSPPPVEDPVVPIVLESTEYCDRLDDVMGFGEGWLCHTIPSIDVMSDAIIDAANRARAKQTSKDGIDRTPFPYADPCWDGYQQAFAEYQSAHYGENTSQYGHSFGLGINWTHKGKTYSQTANQNCAPWTTNPNVHGNEILAVGRVSWVDFFFSGMDLEKFADGWINGYLGSPGHRVSVLRPLPPDKTFYPGVGWSCTSMSLGTADDDYGEICNLILDPMLATSPPP